MHIPSHSAKASHGTVRVGGAGVMGAFRDHEIGERGAAGESCPIDLKLVELVS